MLHGGWLTCNHHEHKYTKFNTGSHLKAMWIIVDTPPKISWWWIRFEYIIYRYTLVHTKSGRADPVQEGWLFVLNYAVVWWVATELCCCKVEVGHSWLVRAHHLLYNNTGSYTAGCQLVQRKLNCHILNMTQLLYTFKFPQEVSIKVISWGWT